MYYMNKELNTQYVSLFRIFAFIILVIPWFLIAGCEEERIDIIVDNYLVFLEVTPEQEPVIKAMLVTARDMVEDYYKKLDPAEQTDNKKMSKESLLDIRIDLLERLNPIMENISQALDNVQHFSWRRSELYYFYNEIRRYALDNYNKVHKLSFEKTVTPGYLKQQQKGVFALDPVEQWTVYLGLQMYSNLASNTMSSLPQEARASFPISIQATFMDTTLLELESAKTGIYPREVSSQPVIEIRVILSTRLHPNYVDINNWISFLEFPNGAEIEPVHVIKRDEQWFADRGLLLSNRIPKFLISSEPIIVARLIKEEPERQAPFRSRVGTETHTEYYQLFFTAFVNEEPLISSSVDYFKLIFLEEIGSVNRAAGTWKFDWKN